MPELSIIVPVYQGERYLHRCIDSILSQSFSDFELILVDDGSMDQSAEICDQYASQDMRITVTHQKNRGVSTARNTGLALAVGKYISFVDADDAIAPEMYTAMISKAKETNAEIIGCGMQYYSASGEYRSRDLLKEMDCNRDEMLSTLFDLPNPLGGSCCNKLFLAATISGIHYNECVTMGEDWLFLFTAFQKATRLYKMPDPFYCVTEHPNSSARKAEISVPVRILSTSRKMMQLAKAYSFSLGNKAIRKYLDDCLRYIRQIRTIGEAAHKPYRFQILRQKCSMGRVLLSALLRRSIPKQEFHRFLFGLIKT